MAINSLSASSKGLSGLVSGMDTQQMVEAMLAGTQGKIDAANQKKSQLTYKQTLYRDVAAKMKSFQTSYLSFTGTTGVNLLSTSFFNSMSASSTSSAFKVTASSNASTGKTVVNYVKQLAQNLKVKTNDVATGKLDGVFDSTKIDDIVSKLQDTNNSLKISADGGGSVDIALDKLAGKSSFEIEQVLQEALKNSSVTVAYKNGQFTFTEKDGKALNINGTKEAMALVGLGRETGLYGAKGVISTTLEGKNLLPSIDVTFNGVKKSITFDPFWSTDPKPDGSPADSKIDQLTDRLNTAVQNAFGAGIKVTNDGSKIEFSSPDASSRITLTRPGAQTSGLDVLGIASGTSSKVSMNMLASQANFVTKVTGSTQRFTINGVDFSFDSNTEMNTIINTINNSAANVKISYSDVEDKFLIESKVSGKLEGVDANNPFKMSQQEGNLLTAMFGVQPGSSATGFGLTYNKEAVGTADTAGKLINTENWAPSVKIGSFNFTLGMPPRDGTTDDYNYTLQEIADKFNELAENGLMKGAIKFEVRSDDGGATQYLAASSTSGTAIELVGFDEKVGMEANAKLGTTIATGDTTLKQLGLENAVIKIGSTEINVRGSSITTAEGLRAAMDTAVKGIAGVGPDAKVEFDDSTGRYRIFGIDIPMKFEISGDDGKLFGTSEFTLGSNGNKPDMTVMQQGQNAIVSINGMEVERGTNEFTVSGLSFELKEVNYKENPDGTVVDTSADITVSRDTDKVFEGLKKFVEDYNKLVDGINELIDEDASYRDYPPLTAKQKEGMSDKEVELWEEKAKEGLLRNDSTLESVMQGLRSTLYKKPAGSTFALYDIGITTKYSDETRDTLQIDESRLKQALSENPDAIMKLFTDSTEGFGRQLDNAIKAAVNTSPANPGSIVRQAGSAGITDTNSFIYREIKDVNSRLSSLERTYNAESRRYWSQFNKMEQVIANMNQQSSWLGQQFAG